MDVITTHLNADFDCLGAMIGARRLYPGAVMAFSGSQEKSMRDFFLKSTGYVFDFTRAKDVDLTAVTRLILVDCQHSSRIGRFAELLDKPEIEVHVYDHHPETGGDVRRSGGVVRECGSSTTIVAKILMEQGVTLTPAEATVMMLGIYEDTGSLTFPSTSAEDFHVAAWLLEQGAALATVSDFITQEMTAEQVSLLDDLLKSLQTKTINNVDISVAHASVEYYIGDIAVLAHMIRDMENVETLFVVVAMGKRIYLVGRSRAAEVDVGDILRHFGGGGHPAAASATVRDLTIFQTLAKLEEVLLERVQPRKYARDLMTTSVKSVEAGATIEEARDLLVRYNLNAMPVVRGGRMIGIISRRIVEKALFHRLGDVSVCDYMHTEYLRATPETPIAEIQEYIVTGNRRFVPVFSGEELVGVITRTDLLRYMYSGFQVASDGIFDMANEAVRVRRRGVDQIMQKALPERVRQILRNLGEVGDILDLPVYAVGGFVRDLLLGTRNLDVDVTVEGDGILFAETFAARHGCRMKSHEKFGTAVIVFPDGFKVDVASTRLEYYDTPGALPTVERSSLKMDLYRRDFTINTLAVRLNHGHYGMLIDYFAGQRDLREKVIRVLHNLSFVEDPTRVFRAIRFEKRLGFRIAAHTENLIRNAVKMNFLATLGGKRLLSELVHILNEREPLPAIARLANLSLLTCIHPKVQLDREVTVLLEETQRTVTWFDLLYLQIEYRTWAVYFLALTAALDADEFIGLCVKLAVAEHYRSRLAETRESGVHVLSELELAVAAGVGVRNSELYRLLHPLPVEILLHLMARTKEEQVRRQISFYFTHLQDQHRLITGEDLARLGLPPGPHFRIILEKVLDERLDGNVVTLEDELAVTKTEVAAVLRGSAAK